MTINVENELSCSDSYFKLRNSYDFDESLDDSSQNKKEDFLKYMFACKDNKNYARKKKKEPLLNLALRMS